MIGIFRGYHSLLMDEMDVTTVISVLRSYGWRCSNIHPENCGWAEYPNMWFVAFHCSNSTYDSILTDLLSLGELSGHKRGKKNNIRDIVFKKKEMEEKLNIVECDDETET